MKTARDMKLSQCALIVFALTHDPRIASGRAASDTQISLNIKIGCLANGPAREYHLARGSFGLSGGPRHKTISSQCTIWLGTKTKYAFNHHLSVR